MQNFLFRVYCYVDKYNLSDLSKLGRNINIIYRNYESIDHLKNLKKLSVFCKKNGNELYASNNIKLSIRLKLNGVYIPSFNNKLNYCGSFSLPKKFKIIGSAHNIIEIKIKQLQGCKAIFISPIFFNPKNRKYLGISKFNLLTLHTASKIIALGGLNQKNIKKLRLTRSIGLAGISLFKKKAPLNL